MKNSILAFASILFLLFISCSKTPDKSAAPTISEREIKIYAPIASAMLINEDDITKYSTFNLFDNDTATVFAVDYPDFDKKGWLLEILFSEPAVFDTLSIEGGNFDKSDFKKNDRVKGLSLEIWNCFNKDYEKSLVLKNKMTEQTLYSGEKIIATKIRINVDSIYSSSQGYLMISDLNFYLDGKRVPVYFGNGKCIYGEESKYSYDDFFELRSSQKEGLEFFNDGVKIVAEKHTDSQDETFYINQYFYDGLGELKYIIRICENTNWSNKFTEFVYNGKNQLVKEISYADATIYKERYTE